MDNLNNNWLENVRGETLTSFFKLFPFFASDYFYIIFIAAGYWALRQKKLFVDLGFLVSFSTLANIILKNIFALPRPHVSLHLVPYHIDYGFPSGDVQVGLVFWGMIFLNTQGAVLKVFACFIITAISLSRIYLGVHSIADVTAGLAFGSLILFIYNSSFCQEMRNRWFQNSTKSYWYLISLMSLVYISTVINRPIAALALASIGTLIGIGISLKYFNSDSKETANIFQIFCSLIVLFLFYKFFPLNKSNDAIFYLSAILKYATLVLMIYILLPLLQNKITVSKFFRSQE